MNAIKSPKKKKNSNHISSFGIKVIDLPSPSLPPYTYNINTIQL